MNLSRLQKRSLSSGKTTTYKSLAMKILFLTFGSEMVASSRTRVFQYLPFFKNNKIDYRVVPYHSGLACHLGSLQPKNLVNKLVRKVLYQVVEIYDLFFQRLWFLILANYYDLIFIQKALLPICLVKFLKKRKKIIFDFDDAIYANPAYNRKRFDTQISLYDLVVLENVYTKQYVNEHGNKNVTMITGPIDCKRYYPENRIGKDGIVIGWIGNPTTEKYLNILKDIFKKLSVMYENLTFELIGAQRINFQGVSLKLKQWSLATEVANLQNFDIGIMPLPDNKWTRGKGGYKLLQYMAVGVPSVVSPVGINREIINEGINGFLVNSEREWIEKLSLLIENRELRLRMGREARRMAEEVYSYRVNAPKLISALRGLYNNEKD